MHVDVVARQAAGACCLNLQLDEQIPLDEPDKKVASVDKLTAGTGFLRQLRAKSGHFWIRLSSAQPFAKHVQKLRTKVTECGNRPVCLEERRRAFPANGHRHRS